MKGLTVNLSNVARVNYTSKLPIREKYNRFYFHIAHTAVGVGRQRQSLSSCSWPDHSGVQKSRMRPNDRPRKRIPTRGSPAAPKSRNALPEDLPAKAFKMAQR